MIHQREGLNVLNGSTAETSLRRGPAIDFASAFLSVFSNVGECHKDPWVYQSYNIQKPHQVIYVYIM